MVSDAPRGLEPRLQRVYTRVRPRRDARLATPLLILPPQPSAVNRRRSTHRMLRASRALCLPHVRAAGMETRGGARELPKVEQPIFLRAEALRPAHWRAIALSPRTGWVVGIVARRPAATATTWPVAHGGGK